MAITELKMKLGALLRAHLKYSGLRQLDLAAALALSPSAVSQMLSGRMVPSLAQLEVMCEKLALNRRQVAELRDCLSRIRTGESDISSPLNDFLKNARIRRGISIQQLSDMTGIPAVDLKMLETKVGIRPSPTEAVRLSAALDCELTELWNVTPPPAPDFSSGEVELHDGVPYVAKAAKNAPVVRLESLGYFDASMESPLLFAWRHLVEIRPIPEMDLVYVRVPGTFLNWPAGYEFDLLVAPEQTPARGVAVLAGCGAKVVLGEIRPDGAVVTLAEHAAVAVPDWLWPVRDMSMRWNAERQKAVSGRDSGMGKSGI